MDKDNENKSKQAKKVETKDDISKKIDDIVNKRKKENEEQEDLVKNFKPQIDKERLDLTEFDQKEEQEQFNIIKEILTRMYGDNLEVTNTMIFKCVRLTCNKKDITTYLPCNLMVDKKKNELIFQFIKSKKINPVIFVLAVFAFLIATAASTYSATIYMKRAKLNKDIDGDKIPDINIDLNSDDTADINIDINDDNKPDVNIDYYSNWSSVFNIDTTGDGKADSNLVTDASTDELYKNCKLNCDIDGDGWPEVNLDTDGDGVANFNIDLDKDKIPDLNIDLDGDMKCDIMCDTNDDNKCDLNCIYSDSGYKENGSSSETGNPNAGTESASLKIVYSENSLVTAENIFPTDQEGISTEVPDKILTVENKSTIKLKYSIKLIVYTNTFNVNGHNNFQYKISSSNGGYETDWTAAPTSTTVIKYDIIIKPKVIQKYTFSLRLKGTGTNQNYDQGKEFKAKIEVNTTDTLSEVQ